MDLRGGASETDVGAEKQRVREAVWARLEEARAAAFPGAWGRIPNFKGAGEAAARLAARPEWQRDLGF